MRVPTRVLTRARRAQMNEANRWAWDKPLQEYVTAIQTGKGETKQGYSSRYIGSMVGDVHRTLLYGAPPPLPPRGPRAALTLRGLCLGRWHLRLPRGHQEPGWQAASAVRGGAHVVPH